MATTTPTAPIVRADVVNAEGWPLPLGLLRQIRDLTKRAWHDFLDSARCVFYRETT
jgi:hypothetical protein